jgi:hypothetical protein
MEIPDFLVARQLPQAHGLHDSPNATMHMEFLVDKEALDGSSGACGRSSGGASGGVFWATPRDWGRKTSGV